MEIKQKDREIIRHLRNGNHLNISEVARSLNLPISTVNDRIKRIEERHILKRSSLLDFNSLGYSANAVLAIKAFAPKREVFMNFLKSSQSVNSIYHINSGFDFMVELVCRDAVELKNMVERMRIDYGADVTVFNILKIEDKEVFTPV